jgi:hypothetical protein
MAQVSESTTGIQEAVRSLQSQNPRQYDQADSGETAENGRSDRIDTQKANDSAGQAQKTQDRVQLSPEAQNQTRENRVDEGARNIDNLRPPSEQRANERGASQRLTDQNEINSSGALNFEGGVDRTQSDAPSGNSAQEVNVERSRTDSREAAQTSDQIKTQARDYQNSEASVRESSNKDETFIESRKLSKSAEEIEGPRERAEAAKETVFDIPSQRIIEEVEPGETGQAKFASDNARSEQAGSTRQPPSPSSVQTETGQNVDDLI